jgi:hypothetical protein
VTEQDEKALWEKIHPFWAAVDNSMHTPLEGEILLQKTDQKPWESSFPDVKAAWAALTAPEHLSLLEWWASRGSLNPVAEEATKRALADCRARQSKL